VCHCVHVCVCWWVKLILFIHIHLIEVHIMETFVSNFVGSSFKHALRSYDLCLVLTYEYEISIFLKNYILLDNQLSFLQVRQNNMAHLNQCLLLNIIFFLTMSHSKIKFKFHIWFTSRNGHQWTSICDKNKTCFNEMFVQRFHNLLDSWIFTKVNLHLE
jgi:hypothetical protein